MVKLLDCSGELFFFFFLTFQGIFSKVNHTLFIQQLITQLKKKKAMDHLIQSQDEKMGIEKLSNLIKILQLVDGQLSVFSHGIMLLVSSYLPLAFFFFSLFFLMFFLFIQFISCLEKMRGRSEPCISSTFSLFQAGDYQNSFFFFFFFF